MERRHFYTARTRVTGGDVKYQMIQRYIYISHLIQADFRYFYITRSQVYSTKQTKLFDTNILSVAVCHVAHTAPLCC